MPLTYDGISLEILKTNRVEREAIFDDQGSYLHTVWTIDVNAVINPHATSYAANGVATPGQFPDVTDRAIRFALLQPRKSLVWTVDQQPALESPPLVGGVQAPCDVINGPHPQVFPIARVDGAKTLMVRFVVKTALIECPADSGIGPLVSNTYTTTHEIDRQFRTTVTYSGMAKFRADILRAQQQTADFYRSQLLPPLPGRFQRVAGRFQLAPDGLTLAWSVTDQEQYYHIGKSDPREGGLGVTRVDADFSTSTTFGPDGANNGVQLYSMNVRVEGSAYAFIWGLTQAALRVAQTRLPFGSPGFFVRSAAIRQVLTGQSVDLQVTMQGPTQPAGAAAALIFNGGLLRGDIASDPSNTNPNFPTDAGSRGTAPLRMVDAALREACGFTPPAARLQDSVPAVPGSPDAPAVPDVRVFVGDVIPGQAVPVSPEGAAFPFTACSVDVTIENDEGVLTAPVAGGALGVTEFLRVATPRSQMTADWVVERVGEQPIFPTPTPTDPNLVLLKKEFKGASPSLMADGENLCWRAAGRYVYGMKYQASIGRDALPTGILPWLTLDTAKAFFTADNFRAGILPFTGGAVGGLGGAPNG